MSATLERARARFIANRDAARRAAAVALPSQLGVEFHLSGWTGKVREAYLDQWNGEHRSGWDWVEIFRRHNDPDRLDIAIWSQNRLSGLALCLTSGTCVEIRFLEGDPREDCPLKGHRTLIVLECAANYAQARGKTELRIQPVNSDLETLYKDVYEFSLETPRGQAHYYRKVV